MIAVYASCIVSDANVAKFKELAKQLIDATRKEKGNVSYNLIQGAENKNLFAFLEQWESKEILDAHMNTPHFTTIIPQIGALLDGEMTITAHNVVI